MWFMKTLKDMLPTEDKTIKIQKEQISLTKKDCCVQLKLSQLGK